MATESFDHSASLEQKGFSYENRREREFYRYYDPVRALTDSGPLLCDLNDAEAVSSHRAISSPDRALTAFCQLGALRLGTRRAMLFFFDTNFAYILAEATQTLSLEDDSVHEIDDALWLGHSIIPRGYSICEETVCKLPSDGEHPIFQGRGVHVIPDLESDTAFCDRPYVLDGPKAKFYAGVPIVTPNGISIGAFCCLDDKTRPGGLEQKHIDFLHDMAATVMTHLDMVRAKAEHERGTRMVTGLGGFVKGASSTREWMDRKMRPRSRRKKLDLNTTPFSRSRSASVKSATAPYPVHEISESGSARHGQQKSPRRNSVRRLHNLLERPEASKINLTIERATHLIRESTDVDGVMFLDANMSSYGGLVSSDNLSGSDHGSDAMDNYANSAESETSSSTIPRSPGNYIGNPCRIIAQSVDHNRTRPFSGTILESDVITEQFLRALLQRNPQGKIWNFNQQGDVSSEDDSTGSASSGLDLDPASTTSTPAKSASSRRVRTKLDDNKEIRRLFPGVRSLAVIGIWDHTLEKWYAACVLWTHSPLRLFSPELELSYLSAFCDVVMAEVHRLEALNSDNAKSDFISSISHELRSPLHGILGSLECLQDQLKDDFSISLTHQADACARTLLDVIDHVLDYSKITHLGRHKSDTLQDHGYLAVRNSLNVGHSGGPENLSATELVPIDEITEEVVETTAYSYACSRNGGAVLNGKVIVIMDIEQGVSWRSHFPLGGWKRVCINLVGNALKYTSEGHVKVSLKTKSFPGKKRRSNVIFSVTDTGRGMSKTFLANHLFKAFSQEDSLVEGTGLGMSLVAKIVRSMKGKIEVQSEKGIGTTVTVRIPLRSERPAHGPAQASNASTTAINSADTHPPRTGLAILRPLSSSNRVVDNSSHSRLLIDSVERIYQSIGARLEYLTDLQQESSCEVYLIFEQDFDQSSLRTILTTAVRPIVLVCRSIMAERELRMALRGAVSSTVTYISPPYGPHKLMAALKSGKDLRIEQSLQDNHLDRRAESTIMKNAAIANLAAIVNELEISARDHVTPGPQAIHNAPHLSPTLSFTRTEGARGKGTLKDEDYFMERSLSTGNTPQSPQAVTPIPQSSVVGKAEQVAFNSQNPQSEVDSKLVNSQEIPHGPIDRPTSSSLSLLLVDDNSINLRLLVNYATKQGHPRLTASNGREAVEAYKEAWTRKWEAKEGKGVESPPQVVLMDINMPVMNGFNATRMIRAFEKQHELRPAHIVALTGLSSAAAQQEAFGCGADLFLTKPVRLKELTKLLDNIQAAEPMFGSDVEA